MRVGVKQGIMQGVTVGTTNCVFLCSYALAFWYGSTRVRAGAYDGERPPFMTCRSMIGRIHGACCMAWCQAVVESLLHWALRQAFIRIIYTSLRLRKGLLTRRRRRHERAVRGAAGRLRAGPGRAQHPVLCGRAGGRRPRAGHDRQVRT